MGVDGVKMDTEVIGQKAIRPAGQLLRESATHANISVKNKDGRVFVSFDRQIHEFNMSGNQAIQLGRSLMKYGRKANKPRG